MRRLSWAYTGHMSSGFSIGLCVCGDEVGDEVGGVGGGGGLNYFSLKALYKLVTRLASVVFVLYLFLSFST